MSSIVSSTRRLQSAIGQTTQVLKSNTTPYQAIRTFHSTTLVQDKRDKAPSPTKGTIIQTKGPSPVLRPPQKGLSENVPRTVVRAPEGIKEIKQNILKLVDEEVEYLTESTGVMGALSSEMAKEYLEKSQYKIEDLKTHVIMTRAQENNEIVVRFNKFEEDQFEDDQQNESQQQGEEEEEQEQQAESEEGQTFQMKQRLNVEIKFKKDDGSVKGKWVLNGYAGKDNRLYIEDMSVVQADPTITPETEMNILPFETLSDDMQDRIYDFLDEVAVDDSLASFVKAYVVESESKSAVNILKELKDLMQ